MKMPSNDDDREQVSENVRIFRRGRRWYANFQRDGKQYRRTLATTNKKEARRRALKIEGEISTGRWRSETAPAKFDEGIRAYQDDYRSRTLADSTIVRYDGILKRVKAMASRLGITKLSGTSLRFVDAFRKMRKDDGRSPTTIDLELVALRQMINFALSRDLLSTDPLKGLKLKKQKPQPQPCWTYDEMQLILKTCPTEILAALTLLAETGMRFGEFAWLTWVDVEKNAIRIQPKPGWKPKTGDRRSIPLTPDARAVLSHLPRHWKWVATMPPTRQRPESGRQWEESRLLAALQRVLKSLGLTGKLHTFRHSFISNALLRGTPVAVVREWVGHVDDKILKLYTHVHDDASQEAMRKLARANAAAAQAESGAENSGS